MLEFLNRKEKDCKDGQPTADGLLTHVAIINEIIIYSYQRANIFHDRNRLSVNEFIENRGLSLVSGALSSWNCIISCAFYSRTFICS